MRKRFNSGCGGCDLPQLDRVRWHLFPEIRVSQRTFGLGSLSAPKIETVPDIVRVMDLQQE